MGQSQVLRGLGCFWGSSAGEVGCGRVTPGGAVPSAGAVGEGLQPCSFWGWCPQNPFSCLVHSLSLQIITFSALWLIRGSFSPEIPPAATESSLLFLLCAATQQGSWAQQLSATRAGPVTWAWSRADGGTDADRGTDASGASQCFPAAVRCLWALLYSWQVRGGVGGDMQSPPAGMSGNRTGLSCCRADQRGWVPAGTEGSSLWVSACWVCSGGCAVGWPCW